MEQAGVAADRFQDSRGGNLAIGSGHVLLLKTGKGVLFRTLGASLVQQPIACETRTSPRLRRRDIPVRDQRDRNVHYTLAGLVRILAFHALRRNEMQGELAVVVVEAQRQDLSIPGCAAEGLTVGCIHQDGIKPACLRLQFDAEAHFSSATLDRTVPQTGGCLHLRLACERNRYEQGAKPRHHNDEEMMPFSARQNHSPQLLSHWSLRIYRQEGGCAKAYR